MDWRRAFEILGFHTSREPNAEALIPAAAIIAAALLVGRFAGARAVSVLTRDGKEHLIPNETLMTERVDNWGYSDKNVRIRIAVGIVYDADIDLAQRLVDAAVASPRALVQPPPVVWLKGFGESSVDHEILVWIEDPEAGVGNVQSDILNRLFRAFREHGIEIPFAQRDIRIKEMPGVEQTRAGSDALAHTSATHGAERG